MNISKIACIFLILWVGCTESTRPTINEEASQSTVTTKSSKNSTSKIFTEIPTAQSGLNFNNEIVENEEINYFKYTYLYNGGGVGIADINNDDLPDVYFTSTKGKDKLFINKGNLQFEDISEQAGINKYLGYKTGVSFVDVNADGWMDIYVCRAGWSEDAKKRTNLLFINNQNQTFKESAKEYGIADSNRSIQSVFFDYDKDGDLDMYLSNHPKVFRQPIDAVISKINNPTSENTDRFYVNNGNGHFTESGKKVGVFNHGWGLGLVAADFNQDGWTDVYVSNDFQSPDYYYVNNGDGTFKESLKEFFPHCSYFAMGVDFVDINQDQHLDLFVGEMLAEDNIRQKTNMAPMNTDLFKRLIKSGLHYQYMRNTFQINAGNGHFYDVADYAGISKTDWSWSSVFGDYDNDGDNDLLIVNGWLKDTQDKDFTKKANKKARANNNKMPYGEVAKLLKSTPLKNYAFEYTDKLKFENVSDKWGFNFKGFSNGMAFGDLDNDGDLDIITNNINANASLHQNNATGHFIKLKLKGGAQNSQGLNTKVTLKTDQGIQYKEFHTTRGFQSSSEPIVHFGLAANTKITGISVVWSDGKEQELGALAINKNHVVDYQNATDTKLNKSASKTLFKEITAESSLDFQHREIYYDDYEREVLLPHQLSQLGPALAIADVDKNGLDDVYIGGPHQQAGVLYLQNEPKQFVKASEQTWAIDAKYEDIDATFFDANSDGHTDLYVVSGSNESLHDPYLFEDRLYLNNGRGQFQRNETLMPKVFTSGGNVNAFDYDKDGDEDIFIGGRMIPTQYPNPAKSLLLQNNPNGFQDVTQQLAPELDRCGLVTSSAWSDYDGDGLTDLIVVGEWMDVLFFKNDGQRLTLMQNVLPRPITGWWNVVRAADLDGDGDDDYLLGNLGENYKYEASDDQPFEIFAGDFDGNKKQDIVLGYYSNQELFPVRGLQCSSQQLPGVARKFPTYEAFGKANLFEVYGEEIKAALHYQANDFSSVILWNQGGSKFEIADLPYQAQLAPIQDFIIRDFDQDQDLDIILAGNWFVSEAETPRADNGVGQVLKNEQNQFTVLPFTESGFFANKDVRALGLINCGSTSPLVVVANNNAAVQIFE